MIKVMVAEDNIDENSMFCKILTKDENIKVVSYTLDGEKTIEEYFERKPDVLLLDLGMPKVNGLDIINILSSYEEEKSKCNIIVVSGDTGLRANLFNTAKVFRVIPKPANFDYVIQSVKEAVDYNYEIPEKALREILLELRFNIHSTGVAYLTSAIKIAFKRPRLLNNISDLYNEVAKEYHISPNKVRWSIRSTIDTLNRSVSIEDICSIFELNYTPDYPTPKNFITLVVEYFEKK